MRNLFGRLMRHMTTKTTGAEASKLSYSEKIRLRTPLYANPIYHGQYGNDVVRQQFELNKPLMVARLGATELRCIYFYLENRVAANRPYPALIRTSISNNSGVFPTNDADLDKFSEVFLTHIGAVDVMGVWFNYYENVVCNSLCPRAKLVEFGCLEPFCFQAPWSSYFRNRTVLVIHPFAESIMRQYRERRQLLFKNQDVLPDFELKTIKAVQSIADSKCEFTTWFHAYDHICHQISKVDFDVAIIGAGAYGLPLASFVKGTGKQAIHLGGVTQILFGIKGRRWETEYAETTGRLFNEHWIRPSASERPEGYSKVEDGCYW